MKNRYCGDVRYRVSPLHHLVARCSTSDVLAFFNHNHFNVDIFDSFQQTPLYYAIYRGYRLRVILLLERGARVDIQDKDGNTPLHFAVKAGFTEIVNVLLKSNANMEVRNKYGQTVLQYAIVWNYKKSFEEIVTMLLRFGAKVNFQDKDGETPLHSAASRRDSKYVIESLLQKGAKVNIGDKRGNTPLHLASTRVCKEEIISLINRGACIEQKNEEGDTALHCAVKCSVIESVMILLENGADFSAKNSKGQTPLHIAAGEKSEEILKLLITNGANLEAEDYCGNTALHSAAKSYKGEKSLSILLENGADIKKLNNLNERPLVLAFRSHWHDNAEILLDWETEVMDNNTCKFCGLLSLRFQSKCMELLLLNHIIKLIKAKISVCYAIASEHPAVIALSSDCSKEYEKMKTTKIGRNFVFDVFSCYNDPIFVSNKQLQDRFESTSDRLENDFPKYASLLKVTFRKAKRRLELLNSAILCFRYILLNAFDKKPDLILPNELLRKILVNLQEVDLQSVATAWEIKSD